MPVLAFAFSTLAFQVLSVLLLALGFGFVIFFHELGHFVAAKWVGIKVEQFAVGFGQALISWRKGIGFRVGNTQKDYQQRLETYAVHKHPDDPQVQDRSGERYAQALLEAEKDLGLGETEYRLNWIPLGGYVKMLGQDDLRPNATADDPRSYNRKSVGARMIVVSAGVVMNVILAAIGFMILFKIGFRVPPAQVGAISSGSPAQNAMRNVDGRLVHAPLRVGDQILDYQHKPQEDFTKIGLNVALSPEGVAEPMTVKHVDGTVETVLITPESDDLNANFLSLGIRAPVELRGPDPKEVDQKLLQEMQPLELPEMHAVLPGEAVVQINGKDVAPEHYWVLDNALQNAVGDSVKLMVKDETTGKVRNTEVRPHFGQVFGTEQLSIAGMVPRPVIVGVVRDSPARGKLQPGDAVKLIGLGSDRRLNPTSEEFRKLVAQAGDEKRTIDMVVVRNGVDVALSLPASAKIENAKGQSSRGLGVELGYDEMHAVVAALAKNSPAEAAGIPYGDTGAAITAIGGHSVSNWFDIQRYLGEAEPNQPVVVGFSSSRGPGQRELRLSEQEVRSIRELRRTDFLRLREYIVPRRADSLGQAAWWGITETRDFILQFYLTLRRMVGGSVSPSQLMGPVGIFANGARIAFRGWDWLLWFLAMISANLAVVNFLPIPIVDGGLFTFLLLEKIQGRPLSPRTQAIAQYAGLAFLLGVFLFVTYHDIARFAGHVF